MSFAPWRMRRFIIEPRGVAPAWLKLLVPIASVAAALLLGAVFLWLTGSNPWTVYTEMLDTAFGSSRGFSETLVYAVISAPARVSALNSVVLPEFGRPTMPTSSATCCRASAGV